MIDQSVAEVMTPSVRTVSPDTTACGVAALFADHDIGSAVVVNPATEEIVGIVTESDVMGQVAAGAEMGTVAVKSFLSETVISVPSSEEIHEAAHLMKNRSVQRLLVVDDGTLVGIVTTSDLTDYLPRLRSTIRRLSRQHKTDRKTTPQ